MSLNARCYATQLPPILNEEALVRSNGRKFCFESPRWQLDLVDLTHVFRQSDAATIAVLNRLRTGDTTLADENWINNNTSSSKVNSERALFPGRKDCTSRNDSMMAILPGQPITVHSETFCRLGEDNTAEQMPIGAYNYVTPVYHNDAPQNITLKVGCRVRCIKNIYHCIDGFNFTIRTANGQFGTVEDMEFPIGNGVISAVVVTWDALSDRIPAVTHRVKRATWVREQTFLYIRGNDRYGVYAVSRQFPLCVAYAATVHSAQGCTIPTKFDLKTRSWNPDSRGPVPGSAYVALSRATQIANVRLVERFRRSHVVVDPKVHAFYARTASGQ